MKRIVAMMLAVIMLVSLTACGSGSKDSAGSAGTTAGPVSSGTTESDPAGSAADSTSSENQEEPKQEPAGTLPEIDSELFKEIPPIDRLSVTEYTWVEKDGYGTLIMKGIEFYPYDIIEFTIQHLTNSEHYIHRNRLVFTHLCHS